MPASNYNDLDLHRSDFRDANNPLDWCRSTRLRDKLMTEIRTLEERLAALDAGAAVLDYSLRQTCREMIHARRQMCLQLRR